MEAILFVGIQATGKSTYFKQRFFDTHVRINLDMLRTRHREKLLFDACLVAQQSFVVDNTNLTVEDRAHYVGPARSAGFRVVGYYFQSQIRRVGQVLTCSAITLIRVRKMVEQVNDLFHRLGWRQRYCDQASSGRP